MFIQMVIRNIKSIKDFQFNLPLERGLYALTGENGTGKSTIISCAATSFYNPLLYSYFGAPINGSKIEFHFNGNTRVVNSYNGRWFNPSGNLGISGFFEGSIVYGNRFKDVDFSYLKTLASISKSDLLPASRFVAENLGSILHDNKTFYTNLFLLRHMELKKYGLIKQPYYYETDGRLVNQLNMSTGENLLLTILHSLEIRIQRENYTKIPTLILLDEIELALHSSALRRLIYFLDTISRENNFAVLFSTHSIELIRSISPENIYYLQRHADGTIEVVNPCYPVYATRNLESSKFGYDYIILVEDDLAKAIVERILYSKKLLGNKRVLPIAIGGWTQVLRFAYDAIRSNLTLQSTKIIIILDRDIKEQVPGFLKSERIGFTNPPEFLPIKSIEKYLLSNLIVNVDTKLYRTLDNYVFQSTSLQEIISRYQANIKDGKYKDPEKIKNGKSFFGELQQELRQVRKSDEDLCDVIVDYLFEENGANINELTCFLEKVLTVNNQ